MSATSDSEPHRLSVRALAGWHRWGDLHLRQGAFTTAEEGRRGHAQLQATRGEGYVAEQTVTGEWALAGRTVQLSGRIDGLFAEHTPPVIEEIKTTRVAPDKLPVEAVDLHRAQLWLYGALWCEQQNVDQVMLRLCFLDIDSGHEEVLESTETRADLTTFLDLLIQRYLRDLEATDRWCRQRDESLEQISFPYQRYRSGQRDLSVAVYRAAQQGGHAVLQAPTGLGKTMGTLFAATKSLAATDIEKVFYLSARTTTQVLAEQALTDLQAAGANLRYVTLTARDKVCRRDDVACDHLLCSRARGYYDRLPAAREAARTLQQLDTGVIAELAERFHLCPFELSLDLSELADVVICDYNYVFDPNVYLRRYFDAGGAYQLLVDEAHNLPARARDMYSASLDRRRLLQLRRQHGAQYASLSKRLLSLNNALRTTIRAAVPETPAETTWYLLETVPTPVTRALAKLLEQFEQLLAVGSVLPADLLELYFDCLKFSRTLDRLDHHYQVSCEGDEVELYCVDPGNRLSDSYSKVRSVVCFSATLEPRAYYETFLGLADETAWYSLASPFLATNLATLTVTDIKTTWQQREHTVNDLAQAIVDLVSVRPGNYLVYFPSYRYLQMVGELLASRDTGHSLVCQQQGMSESARQAFLDSFSETSTTLGLAVTGSIFAEGIDLRGDRLIGTVIVGVAMPQIDRRNEMIRGHFGGDTGFEMAYVFPGVSRILQTAGRVIRSETDRGIVCLIDHRYAWQRYQRLLPADWQLQSASYHRGLVAPAAGDFWAATPPPATGQGATLHSTQSEKRPG